MMQFEQAIQAAGLPAQLIPTDGKIHRFGKDKNCWAVNYGGAGAFGDWSKGIKETWHDDSKQLSPMERQELSVKIAEAQKLAQEERLKEQEAVSKQALTKWQSLKEKGTSQYLERKQVKAFGVKFDGNALVIPVADINGKIWSLQTIHEDGTKRFLAGGKKKGCFHVIGNLATAKQVYVCEGYSTAASVHMATCETVIVTFDAGNIEPVIAEIKKKYPNIKITIAADDDAYKEINTGKVKAEEAARLHSCRVVLPKFTNTETGPTDFNDLHVLDGLETVKNQLKEKRLNAITLHDFMSLDIKPQDMILEPIISKQGLAMLYAFRGMGKTFVSLGIAYAIASGSNFLKWKCNKPYKVLLIDGEMPASSLQDRMASLIESNNKELHSPDYLRIITPDLQERGIPSLHSAEGQEALEPYLDGVSLVIVDNISTLCRGGRENEAESWLPVQEWALGLRKRGISILFIHHSGKNEQQRGTSRREDVLDCVIALRRPKDYESSQGARFEVYYEKHRNFYGDDAKPFEASLSLDGHKQIWKVKDLEDCQLQKVIELSSNGLKQRDIAIELGIGLGTVNRMLKKAKEGESL